MDFFDIDDGIYINPKYIVTMWVHYAKGTDDDLEHVLKITTVDGEMHAFCTEDRDIFNDKIKTLIRLTHNKFLVNTATGAITELN